jgi:hypothetical protein
MPPKPKDVKKGGPAGGSYKTGKPLKDILPANSKPPREGAPLNGEIQPDINRSYTYEPYPNIVEWPGNDEAKNNDYTKDCVKNEDGTWSKFEDPNKMHLPPSFHEFEKGEIQWLRPDEYLREVAYENEIQKRKLERKLLNRKKKNLRKQGMLSTNASANQSALDDLNNISLAEKHLDSEPSLKKEDIKFEMLCIAYDERLETEEEVKKRKDEAEKNAAADKNAKKKPPPAKGAPVQADPMDEPQVLKIPVENNMDMGFLMPVYSKWVTSQF